MSEQSKDGTFEGWAIVEQLGHRKFAGYIKQVLMGQQAMLRIDVPETQQPSTEVFDPEHGWVRTGKQAVPGFATFISPASLYAMTPCTEEFAREQAAKIGHAPPGFVRIIDAESQRLLTDQSNDDEQDPPF